MPQQIEVPGMGVVEFPDGMSDDAIAAAIKQNMPQQSPMDKLTGKGGERYQTWPERLVRGIASLPQRTMEAAVSAPVGSRELNENLVPLTTEAAAIASPVNSAIRAGDRLVPGAMRALKAEKPKVPTTQELATAGAADIKAAKASDLDIRGQAVADYSRQIQQELFEAGIHPVRAKDTFTVLKELESAPADSLFTASNLQTLREVLGTIAQNFNQNAAKDQLAASRVIKRLDEFIPSVAEKDVLAGTPAATQKLFERGRGNYAAAQRSNDITGVLDRATTGILERAEARAQAANSGRNIDNTIRSKIVSLLEKPKEVSGFNQSELAALNRVAEGGRGRNAARYVGNVLGGGGGFGQSFVSALGAGAGGVTGGIPGAIIGGTVPPALGAGAKSVANALAKRDLRAVDDLIRTRSPLYKERLENPNMAVVSPEKRAAVIRALMLQQQQ